MTVDYDRFLAKYPSYKSTSTIDELRAADYGRLDRAGQVYLDYTGGGLYADSQVRNSTSRCCSSGVFGNPHSSNPTSLAATKLVESARESVLRFFNADPDEYDVIFTQNASGALKVVGEAYPFGPGDQYLLTFDNHNSVNGIREFAHARGAEVTYIPVTLPDMRVDESMLEQAWDKAQPRRKQPVRLPGAVQLLRPCSIRSSGSSAPTPKAGMCCSTRRPSPPPTGSTSRAIKPDFVPLSFYKMFGYPTGIGALIAHRDNLHKLHRPWFAGGTITVASVQGDKYYLAEGHAAFEDGTVDYLNIPAVEIGLHHIERIGIDAIHERVRCLTGWLLDNLTAMHHSHRRAAGARVRTDLHRETRRRGDGQLLRPERAGHRPPLDRRGGQQGQHLPADGLFLQPRRRRDCAGHLAHGTGGLLLAAHARTAPVAGRFPPVHRREVLRRGAHLGRHGHEL